MGGGDLNLKKSWHVSTGKNIEKVRKREQQVLEERRKTEILRKELTEERAREELRRVQEDSGLIIRKKRLDWMYEGNMHRNQQNTSVDTTTTSTGGDDEQMEGGRVMTSAEIKEEEEKNRKGGLMRDVRAPITVSDVKDLEMKVALDPLTEIKRRELDRYEELLKNPYELAKIKGSKKSRRHDDRKHRNSKSSREHRHGDRISKDRKSRYQETGKPSLVDLVRQHEGRWKHRNSRADSRDVASTHDVISKMKDDASKLSDSRTRKVDDARRRDSYEERRNREDRIRSRDNPEFLNALRSDTFHSLSLGERVNRRAARNISLK